MRDDKWLFSKLDEVWDNYFPDVPQDNDVRIVWGRRARTRLGSIKLAPITKNEKHKTQNHPATIITINSLFKDETIPEYVVIGTIAHELSHYAHGFHSPIEQKHATPHAGGVIHKELRERGLGALEKRQKKWIKENWRPYLMQNYAPKPTKRRRRKVIFRWI
jgi:hypothetical protein